MAVTAFNFGGGGKTKVKEKKISSFTFYDNGTMPSYTIQNDGICVFFAGKQSGGYFGCTLKKGGTEISFDIHRYDQYGAGHVMAVFDVKKGDIVSFTTGGQGDAKGSRTCDYEIIVF